jgi:aquaporin Z
MNIRALIGELLGPFTLVFFGSLGVATLAVVTSGQGDPVLAVLIIPWGFGLGLMAAIGIAGPVSGGHFNPAVTLAALFDGRVGWKDAAGYVVAQVFGAAGASLAILLITTKSIVEASVNHPGPIAQSPFDQQLHAFSAEIILTAVFVAVILTVTRKAPDTAIITIPLVLLVIHFVGIQVSGASVNPARSLGPAIVTGTYTDLWVYLTAPFLGAIIGWGAYRLLNPPDEDVEDADENGEPWSDEDDLEESLQARA